MQKQKINIICNYLEYLASGKEEMILRLFAPEAMVISPRTGRVTASYFYTGLFSQLKQSVITGIRMFRGTEDPDEFAVYFHYEWELKDGSRAGLICTDIVSFVRDSDLIRELHVVAYPTQG